jgi:YD repeat-containing protein
VKVRNPDFTSTTTKYDLLGQVTEITDPTGIKTCHAYDKLGRVTSTTAAGITTTFEF